MTTYRALLEDDEVLVIYGASGDAHAEFSSDGIKLFDDSGNVTFDTDAETGDLTAVGTFQNYLTGDGVQISKSTLNQIRGETSGFQSFLVFAANGVTLFWDNILTGNFISVDSTDLGVFTDEIRLRAVKQGRGFCSWEQRAAEVLATGARGYGVMYGGVTKLTNVPSSITFTTEGTDSNVSSVAAADITLRGFRYTVMPTATGVLLRASRSFVTVGN